MHSILFLLFLTTCTVSFDTSDQFASILEHNSPFEQEYLGSKFSGKKTVNVDSTFDDYYSWIAGVAILAVSMMSFDSGSQLQEETTVEVSTQVKSEPETKKCEKSCDMKVEIPSFTLKERTRFTGFSNGVVIPLCGKPAFAKQLAAVPTLLPNFLKKALKSRPNEQFLIFVANGIPMAQQLGCFRGKSLNNNLNRVNKASAEILSIAQKTVAELNVADQERIQFVTWEGVMSNKCYAEYYKMIMENPKASQLVAETALDIIRYRVNSCKKKGVKCVNLLDDNSNLLETQKNLKKFGWAQESIAMEITTLIWGFQVKDFNFKSLFYLTPNSTGMDLISGGAKKIRDYFAEQKIDSVPEQNAIYYMDLKFSE